MKWTSRGAKGSDAVDRGYLIEVRNEAWTGSRGGPWQFRIRPVLSLDTDYIHMWMSGGQTRAEAKEAAAVELDGRLAHKTKSASKLKKFGVSIPITGFVHVEVEARDAKAAREAAWKATDEGLEPEMWEYHEQVTEGNVCYAVLNSIEVQEIK